MKLSFLIFSLVMVALQSSLYAERSLIQVYQPTSLLGTELDDDPLETGESLAATIVSRPVIIGGAFPEAPVHAISLPHRIAGAGKDFPDESNLIVLIGAEIHAEYGDKEHRIVADFSRTKIPDNLGVTLLQVMKLSALCLQKTLGDQYQKPIRISWIAPKGVSITDGQLPLEIKKSGEAGARRPATAPDSKSKGKEKPKPDSKRRPQ